jgi:hypothetical protein
MAAPAANAEAPRSRSAAPGDPWTRIRRTSLTASWLAARLGTDPMRVDVMRRSGELLGVRLPGSYEYRYPAWQLGPNGKPLEVVAAIVAEARGAGLDDLALGELMERRLGLGGNRRLADVLRDGDEAHVIAAIRSAGGR